ncbi:MAG: hypothetical protein Q8L14_19505 [Myxococcales bacterium]|nr:hypothetical protein [Myxococcales bacterium]
MPGTPSVDEKAPQVETDPTRATDMFSVNVPRQCDTFTQLSVRKVDILWVVDSSGSMGPKQQRLAANFQGFINQLVAAMPPIDFHIAVTNTDTDDPATRGRLRQWNLGALRDDFISCAPDMQGTVVCNTGGNTATAVMAFNQMAQVGTSGSPQERGLFAAYLALTNPLNLSTEAVVRFVRPEAALYVVFVSDEDDASCTPLTRQPVCTADPGCRCANDQILTAAGNWGSTDYFTRFFETYKGYGNGDAVAVAAITAIDPDAGVPSQFGDPSPHVGCCRNQRDPDAGCPTSGTNDGGLEIAYFGSRYVQVAAQTGGVAVDICQNDFSGALASLGFSASGLRREFRLTRGPDVRPLNGVARGLEAFVSPPTSMMCMVDGNCPIDQFCRNGRCARRVEVRTDGPTNGAQYVQCDLAGLRNMVRFEGTSVPESLSTVEVCYDVLANFQTTCP